MKRAYGRTLDELENIVRDTGQFFDEQGVDAALRLKVDLSIEELFVNMVNYNTETSEPVRIEWRRLEKGIEVCLTDTDVDRFDPTAQREVDVESPLADRIPGGLGLYLVLKMADSIHYEYENRVSRITFTNRNTDADV